jgi:integrase
MSGSYASPEEVSLVIKAAKSFKRDYSVSSLNTYRRIVDATWQLYEEALYECPPHQFYQHRAAYQWALRSKIDAALALAAEQRLSDPEGAKSTYDRAVRLYEHLESIGTFPAPKGARTSLGKSKRKGLNKLPKGWVETLVDSLGVRCAAAILATAVAGLRPAEIEKGVDVIADSDQLMRFDVTGAKVTATSGHTVRSLWFEPDKEPVARRLWSLVAAAGGRLRVQMKVRTLHKAIVKAVERLGLKGISSYTFRHLLASNLKASDEFDALTIAKALGHRSTRTQRNYGTSRQGKAGGTGLVKADGSEIVRQPSCSLHPQHARDLAAQSTPICEPDI